MVDSKTVNIKQKYALTAKSGTVSLPSSYE